MCNMINIANTDVKFYIKVKSVTPKSSPHKEKKNVSYF